MVSAENQSAHETIRAWINRILEVRGWNPHRLAKEAGVSPSTISRALNDDRFVLTTKTLNKIKKALDIKDDRSLAARETRATGLELISPSKAFEVQKEDLDKIYSSWMENKNTKLYMCETKELEQLGIHPDDIIIVDEESVCRRTDIALVLIQTNDGARKITFRYFDPPYLLTKSFSPENDSKPLLADGETIQIVGRAVGLLRSLPR